MTSGVTTHLTGRHATTGGPLVFVALVYRREQPWEVTARVGATPWVFARDLLALGLHAPAGDGDVRVHPATSAAGAGRVVVELDNGRDDTFAVHLAADALASFVAATARLVPFGAEHHHTDLDALCDVLRRAA